MRRRLILYVLFISMTAIALAAGGRGSDPAIQLARAAQSSPLQHVSRKAARHRLPRKHKATGKVRFLFGVSKVEPHADSNGSGIAGAFPFTDKTVGIARALRVYLGSRNQAETLVVGLYSDRGGRPGTLLASGSRSSSASGKWNTVTLGAHRVLSGRVYWIALLGLRGRLSFRDWPGRGCRSVTSARTSLATLPRPWRTKRTRSTCPISAYVVGTVSSGNGRAAPTKPGPPVIVAAPVGVTTSPVSAPGGYGVNGGPGSCPLTHAGGADASTSCWATHTGVQNGTGYSEAQIEANPTGLGFTKVTGDVTIKQANTTINHEWIVGCISVAANNVTIENTLITSGAQCSPADGNGAAAAITTGDAPGEPVGTLVQDVTIDGGTTPNGDNLAGVFFDSGNMIGVNVLGFTRDFVSGTSTTQYPAYFQDDYAHNFSGCVHDDGTWFDTAQYATFNHGYVLMGDVYGSGCTTAALSGGADYGPQSHVTYENSYAEGADGEDTHAGCGSTYSAFTNNALSTNAKDYGSGFQQSDTGNTWSRNYIVNEVTGAIGAMVPDPQGSTCPG